MAMSEFSIYADEEQTQEVCTIYQDTEKKLIEIIIFIEDKKEVEALVLEIIRNIVHKDNESFKKMNWIQYKICLMTKQIINPLIIEFLKIISNKDNLEIMYNTEEKGYE